MSQSRKSALAIAVPFIKDLESLELKAYPDPKTRGKPYTIGYGCTRKRDGSPWRLGETITAKEAEDLLWYQLENEFLPTIEKTVPTWGEMTSYQRAAIISFAWNCGAHFYGAPRKDTITDCLSSTSKFPRVPEALMLYIDKGTSVEKGLRIRRRKEGDLWKRGSDTSLLAISGITADMFLLDLKPGEVRGLQQLLSRHGLDTGGVDGILGPATLQAWSSFKKSRYLAFPDRIGPASISLLLSDPIAQPMSSNGLADRIYQCCKQRGYPLDRRLGATNIIGLEGINPDGTPNDDAFDRWNDTIAVLTFEKDAPRLMGAWLGTTEPGRSATYAPPNPNGVARMDTGYHKALWGKGKHRGYDALVQIGAARIVRDRNKNGSRDDKVTIERGNGLNLHTTKTTGWKGAATLSSIGPWSAGCTVIFNSVEYAKEALPMLQLGLQGRRNEPFDYCLLWRDWLK